MPVRIILAVLIILEVSLIASRFALNFDDYITVVVILLAFPLAYFGFLYLRHTNTDAKDAERFSGEGFRKAGSQGAETENEVGKLIDSAEYKQFEERKRQQEDHEETAEERMQREEQD